MYFPLDRPFFLRLEKQAGKLIFPNGETLNLATEDVALLSKGMISPIFHHLGYSDEDIQKIKQILEKPVINIDAIIPKVNDIRVYYETNEMDVTIDGHTVRLKGKDFLSPMNFEIWAASVLHTPLDIPKEDWKAFVQYLVMNAKREREDPLSPNAFDEITKKLKMINVYDDFCDSLLETWNDGLREAVVFKDNKLYIPGSIIESVIKKLEISRKSIRDILFPILSEPATMVITRKYMDSRVTKRVWVIDWKKLGDIRDLSGIKIRECGKNDVQA